MIFKSLFISAYITALSVGLAHASYMIYLMPDSMAWWATFFGMLPGMGFFIYIFMLPQARTSSIMWPILGLTTLAVPILLMSGEPTSPLQWLYVLGIGLLGNVIYQFWYSRFGRHLSQQLAVGQPLPNIRLEQANGNKLNVNDVDGPVLMMFFRGNWCPLCMAQIKEVAQAYQALDARGIKTLLISSQPHDNTAKLAKKFNVPFMFLVDPENQAAKQLGILAENGTPTGLQALGYDSDTAMPTVIMTDAAKRIIFCDETDNYRVRPEPDTFIKVFDAHQVAI